MRFRCNLYMWHRHRVPKQPCLGVRKAKIMAPLQSCIVVSETVWKSLRRKEAYTMSVSLSRSDNTWASSVGGPGLNFGEHIAGRSRLGTTNISNLVNGAALHILRAAYREILLQVDPIPAQLFPL